MKSKGLILWLTGLSGSGKTTIAQGIERKLKERGYLVEVLDGDVVRTSLSKGLGFSREDREVNIRRLGFVANLLSRNEVVAIVAAISPYRAARDELRRITKNFVEVYVNAPLEVCEDRDVKGLYAMARAGEVRAFTGIDDPYEEPLDPEIVCHTSEESAKNSIAKVLAELDRLNYIGRSQSEHEVMQEVRSECILNGKAYKEYRVFLNNQPLGVISWDGERDSVAGGWYTTPRDGELQRFQTQEAVIDSLRGTSSDAAKLSAKLKAEAQELTFMAAELESESTNLMAEDEELREQVDEVKAGVEELKVRFKEAKT